MVCADEPKPGDILTDVQAAQFTEGVRMAGADCRSKLKAVKQTADGWPKALK